MQNQLSVTWEWYSILISSLWNMNKITRSCYYQEISQGQDHLRRRIVDTSWEDIFPGPLSKEPYFPRALLPRIVQKYNLFGLADTLPRSGQRAKLSPSDDRKLVEHQVKHSVPIHSEVSIASGWTWRAPTGALTSKWTHLSLTAICSCAHGQAKCLLEKCFMVRWENAWAV